MTTVIKWKAAVLFQERPFCQACNNRLASHQWAVTAQSEPSSSTTWHYYCVRCGPNIAAFIPKTTDGAVPARCSSACCQGNGLHFVPSPGTGLGFHPTRSCPAWHALRLMQDNGMRTVVARKEG